MTHLSAVVQIGIRDVGMEIETLLRHVQHSGKREGCLKTSKNLRKAATKHKKGVVMVIFRKRRGTTRVQGDSLVCS